MRPTKFHPSLIKKELDDMLDLDEEAQSKIKPNVFLRDRILTQITSVQVLVFGNTAKEQAVEFCTNNIVKKFVTTEGDICSQKVGSIHTDGVEEVDLQKLSMTRNHSKTTNLAVSEIANGQ